jgi:hypothetical protein
MPIAGTRGLPGLYLNLLEDDVALVPYSRHLSRITLSGQCTHSVLEGGRSAIKRIPMVSGAVIILIAV